MVVIISRLIITLSSLPTCQKCYTRIPLSKKINSTSCRGNFLIRRSVKTADREQVAQLQVLNKAQQRQIDDLERKLEDSRRNMRYIEHQFAINTMKLKVADAAVDSMKQQMLELCRSDTLSRARQQHDRDLAIIKEQHEAALLGLQQKLDSTSQALNDQVTSTGIHDSFSFCFVSTALNHLSDSKLPKDEALRLLRVEMQRCLGCLKGKRQKIGQLQEELQHSQARVSELQAELEEAKLNSSQCYIAVCKEKCSLEETAQKRDHEESSIAVQRLRGELEAKHQASMMQLKEDWSKEKEAEIQQEVSSHVASTEAKWKKELQKV
ncbi:hypothetical protein XENOCAPTIV_029579 [Xenoophorus captivus]|uniref:Uncharacterized protein n=1 Tax=Xenoophorus captivus TaxID=1517983 RepID=A0ABV0Q7N3_9TELE